jgi:hypothetical protein
MKDKYSWEDIRLGGSATDTFAKKMLYFIVCGGLLTDSDRTVRQKSWKLWNWDVVVVCSDINYEKAMTIIDPVTMHAAHW